MAEKGGIRLLYWELFFTFFKIGLFTFGGGYAMISLITAACVEKKGWITHDDMMHITVIAETTPGPIAINCATFVGQKQKGLGGAICATLGVVLPSFIIIYLISLFLDRFLAIGWVANAFAGIRVGVAILILRAGIRMARKQAETTLAKILLFGAMAVMVLASLMSLHLSSIVLMVFCAAVSLCCFAVQKGGRK